MRQKGGSLLVVSAQTKFNESLKEIISERGYSYSLVTSVSNAKRIVLERNFDYILVNAPLPDENGVRFSADNSKGSCTVLLLIREEYYAETFDLVCPYGVFTLPKPTSRQMITQAFDWLESNHERIKQSEKKTLSAEEKLEEIRRVNRAKLLLISNENLSETEAHHRIEKLAMDNGITKITAADLIINKYE